MRIIIGFMLVCVVFSCKNKKGASPVACTQEAKAGLNIKVKDIATGVTLGDSVTVTATDAVYTETLQNTGVGEFRFVGAFERAGTYVITAKRNGYNTFTSSALIVGKDECHVIPQTLVVPLQPK